MQVDLPLSQAGPEQDKRAELEGTFACLAGRWATGLPCPWAGNYMMDQPFLGSQAFRCRLCDYTTSSLYWVSSLLQITALLCLHNHRNQFLMINLFPIYLCLLR